MRLHEWTVLTGLALAVLAAWTGFENPGWYGILLLSTSLFGFAWSAGLADLQAVSTGSAVSKR